MTDKQRNDYIKWLARKVEVPLSAEPDMSYNLLMRALFEKEFYSLVQYDENREEDGLNLREDYFNGSEDGVCSVLEMMVALAIRCSYDILYNVADAATVFWDMIRNLGLDEATDLRFDEDSVDVILDRFLDREYGKDGSGGLFYRGNHTKIDMRNEEIWWQMQLYSMDKFDGFELY